MRHPSIQALFEYWNTLRGGRIAPRRTEIDPRPIADVLGDLFLLEGSSITFQFRLAGSRMTAALSRALTGKSYDDLWLPSARASARAALTIAAEETDPVLIGIRAYEPEPETENAATPSEPVVLRPRWPNFRPVQDVEERRGTVLSAGEMLLLPLQAHDGIRILGALALFDTPFTTKEGPRPLDASGLRILSRAALTHTGMGLVAGELARQVSERRRHLTVIEGTNTRDS